MIGRDPIFEKIKNGNEEWMAEYYIHKCKRMGKRKFLKRILLKSQIKK